MEIKRNQNKEIDLLLVTIPDITLGHNLRLTGMPPLGLSYVKAYTLCAGFSCRILNLFSMKSERFMDMEPAIRIVCETDFKILGVGGQEHDFFDLVDFCEEIKSRKKDIKIIVGGYIGFSYKDVMEASPAVDYVVVGEGEVITPLLLNEMLTGGNGIEEIKGVAYRSSGGICFNGMREQIMDVEGLLPPDLSDTPPYLKDGMRRHHMVTSRGCFNRGCNYCSTELMHLRYRVMSPKKVAEEAGIIFREHPDLAIIHFDDDSFDIARLMPIHAEFKRRGMENVRFAFQSTAANVLKNRDKLSDPDLRRIVDEIHLGIESFNAEQLLEYNKRITTEENWGAVQILHELDVNFIPYLIVDRTPDRLESSIPKLTHSLFWPRLDSIQPLLNHPHTRIAEISKSFYRERKNESAVSYAELKKRVEKRYNRVWEHREFPEYDTKKLEASWNRQRKMAERLNVQPWQDAFCALLRPWFDGLETVLAEMNTHTRLLGDLKRGFSVAEEEGNLYEQGHLKQGIEGCRIALESINRLPEIYIRYALDVARLVEMGEYDIYSIPFANLTLAARQLAYDEIMTLLEGLRSQVGMTNT